MSPVLQRGGLLSPALFFQSCWFLQKENLGLLELKCSITSHLPNSPWTVTEWPTSFSSCGQKPFRSKDWVAFFLKTDWNLLPHPPQNLNVKPDIIHRTQGIMGSVVVSIYPTAYWWQQSMGLPTFNTLLFKTYFWGGFLVKQVFKNKPVIAVWAVAGNSEKLLVSEQIQWNYSHP